jgi:hypothetical protein
MLVLNIAVSFRASVKNNCEEGSLYGIPSAQIFQMGLVWRYRNWSCKFSLSL